MLTYDLIVDYLDSDFNIHLVELEDARFAVIKQDSEKGPIEVLKAPSTNYGLVQKIFMGFVNGDYSN